MPSRRCIIVLRLSRAAMYTIDCNDERRDRNTKHVAAASSCRRVQLFDCLIMEGLDLPNGQEYLWRGCRVALVFDLQSRD